MYEKRKEATIKISSADFFDLRASTVEWDVKQ